MYLLNMALKFIVLTLALFEVSFSIPLVPSPSGLAAKKFIPANGHSLVGIYGGHNITINQAKYIGAILGKDQTLLGTATILNNRWILTAAYNFYNLTPEDVHIRVGSSFSSRQGQLFKVHEIFRPSKYEGYWDYDVALAKLSTPLKFSGTVGTTSISSSPLPKEGSIGVTSGYGLTKTTFGSLQQVSLPISHYATCKPLIPYTFSTLSFCTIKEGAGPCAYDFGSPLIYKNKVVGIYVGAFGCGSSSTPSVFGNISKYSGWIENTIKKNTEEGEVLEYNEVEA